MGGWTTGWLCGFNHRLWLCVEQYHPVCILQDREVIKVKINRENVFNITEEGSTAISKTSDEVTKFGEIFYKSVVPNLPILFENRGGTN